jgi:hypothetical protein
MMQNEDTMEDQHHNDEDTDEDGMNIDELGMEDAESDYDTQVGEHILVNMWLILLIHEKSRSSPEEYI